MEMVPIYTRSFELEEFIHGPQNAFDKDTCYIMLGDQSLGVDKFVGIYDFLGNEIGNVIQIGDVTKGDHDIYFEYASEHFRMLENITVLQTLAYYLAKERGRDLSQRLHSEIDRYVRKTL